MGALFIVPWESSCRRQTLTHAAGKGVCLDHILCERFIVWDGFAGWKSYTLNLCVVSMFQSNMSSFSPMCEPMPGSGPCGRGATLQCISSTLMTCYCNESTQGLQLPGQ